MSGCAGWIPRMLYNALLLPVGAAGAWCMKPFNRKLSRTLDARTGWRERWRAGTKSIGDRPVWFHVSSVGEFEQARPLIQLMQERTPDVPVALTFLSPSGYLFATRRESLDEKNNIKFIEYLPLDFGRNVRFCLASLRPRALVFVKFDLWPNLIRLAREHGVPALLIDGTLSSGSLRFSRPGRAFYRPVYRALDAILAISKADAARFRSSCPDHPSITVTGDTRFDRVAQRKQRPLEFPVSTGGKTVFIAGSIWPEDEARILPALGKIAGEHEELILVLAPHEPTPEHVRSLVEWARSRELSVELLGTLAEGTAARVIVVDTVGVLAELYRIADIAYVGGSFSSGVHNVIEPAIMGIPVLFGPAHSNSFEALELIDRGGAVAIASAEDAGREFGALVREPHARVTMGKKAAAYVDTQLGATERCWQALAPHLGGERNAD